MVFFRFGCPSYSLDLYHAVFTLFTVVSTRHRECRFVRAGRRHKYPKGVESTHSRLRERPLKIDSAPMAGDHCDRSFTHQETSDSFGRLCRLHDYVELSLRIRAKCRWAAADAYFALHIIKASSGSRVKSQAHGSVESSRRVREVWPRPSPSWSGRPRCNDAW